MIISKTTEIKINAANFKHYKQFYDTIKCNKIIEVKISELTKTSVALIKLKCDNCDIEKEITFKNYTSYGYNNGEYLCRGCKLEKNNLEKYGVKNVFQVKEVKEKIKETNLEKYGVEFISQSEEIQNKIKETNLEKYGVEYFLQSEDVHNRIKETNLKKYGVKNVSQINSIKKKKVNTCLKNYGVEYNSQSELIQDKIKETNLKKYGVEHNLQSEEIKNKIKETNLKKYGVENPFESKTIQEKIKQTNLESYGVNNYRKTDECDNKIKETNLEKYGVEYGLQNEEIKEKGNQTNLENYGVSNYSKTNEYLVKTKLTNLNNYGVDNYNKSEESKLNTIIGQHPNYKKYIGNNVSLFKCDLNKDHEFEIHIDTFHRRVKSNLPICLICYPIGNSRSIKEEIIYEYIKSIYSGEVIQSYRDVLEIDIYLPELKTGIEFNGLYWHSNKYKENNYHINKLNWFKEKGINIKMIYEDDFDNNLDIIKSQINNWLGLTKIKIYARKTYIKQISSTEEYRNFLNQNHIQGYVASKLVYGLYYENSLVSLMCFDKKEGRINMEETGWNLNRFCNLLNHNIVGGASKLLNHFIKENNPKKVISYADKDWSNGNLYFTLGFKLVNESKPDYKYVVDGVRKSKQNFTKTKLAKLGHDISLTEAKIMKNLGINRIYDCGKMKFEKYV